MKPNVMILPEPNMNPEEYVKTVRDYLKTSILHGMHETSEEHRREFLNDPVRTNLSTGDLTFLCSKLNIKGSAFFTPYKHCRFLTHAGNDEIRAYDPFVDNIQTCDTDSFLKNYIYVFLSPDLNQEYNRYTILKPLTKSQFLIERGYEKREGFSLRLGRTQFNKYDCVPLSLYAAANSGPPLVNLERPEIRIS